MAEREFKSQKGEKMSMKLLFVASEGAPYAKSGGLGDVIQGLPAELSKRKDVEVTVMLPLYRSIKFVSEFQIEYVTSFATMLSWRQVYTGVFRAVSRSRKLTYYFIDNEYYFNRDGMYGDYDDGERYAFFSKAVLEALQYLNYYPDVIHCHDWQTALVPVFLKAYYQFGEYHNIKTVFTIHNIEYQGKMPDSFGDEILGLSGQWHDVLHFDDCLNLMKGAIVTADKLTTVSRTYSYEILHAYFSHGLDGILKENQYKLCGIVNGIDTDVFHPKKDPALFVNYGPGDLQGKAANKRHLQERLGLEVRDDVPVVALISRLVAHKGLELVEFMMNQMMSLDLQFVVVGTGEARYEDCFRFMEYHYPGRVSANILFDSKLASQVYAGADLFLMPSKSEPCGLSQLIAMRYGTVPIVRETGGLVDTVPPLNTETLEGRGFTFKLFNAHDMLGAVERATEFYRNREQWNRHVKNIMKYNSSWKHPADEYLGLYRELTGC